MTSTPNENSGAELMTVSFVVPNSHALEFQRRGTDLVDELLLDDLDEAVGFAPLSAGVAVARHRNVWALPAWGIGDDDDLRAQWIWDDLKGKDRLRELVLAFLANQAGAPGTEIADQAGYKASGLPPALKHLAMRCRRAQRRPLWEYNDGTYTMTVEAHSLFLQVVKTG